MKDFIKWLGVNEKIAKVAVWLLIIMVTLIIVNTALASLGFPNYQITYSNLVNINIDKKLNIMFKVDVIERDKGFYIVKCVKIKKS